MEKEIKGELETALDAAGEVQIDVDPYSDQTKGLVKTKNTSS